MVCPPWLLKLRSVRGAKLFLSITEYLSLRHCCSSEASLLSIRSLPADAHHANMAHLSHSSVSFPAQKSDSLQSSESSMSYASDQLSLYFLHVFSRLSESNSADCGDLL